MKKRRRRKSGYRKNKKAQDRPFMEHTLEDTMATRDGAKKWLRRAIASGRVIPPAECQGCGTVVRPRPNAYQPDVREPSKILWLCHTCQTNAINARGSMPAHAYSTKDLVLKLLKEAEKAEIVRQQLLEAGQITEDQATADRQQWEARVEAAQDAYRKEMGFDDIGSVVKAEETVDEESPFNMLDEL